MEPKEMLISWLNDAHAMETHLVQVLEAQSKQSSDYPDIKSKIDQHLEQTKRHAEMVKGCVEELGERTSALKSGMSTIMGTIQGVSTSPAEDTLIKNALSDFGAENFEIASYTALVEAANSLGLTQIVTTCKTILQDEQEMAQWLQTNLPLVVRMELNETAGAVA